MLERRRIPAAAAAGDDEAQKLRINASGRIATLAFPEEAARGWLVEARRERGRGRRPARAAVHPHELRDPSGRGGQRRRPHQEEAPAADGAPGAAPAPAPRKRRKPKDFEEGDRVTVLESADSHGGRSGAIVEKNTAWWRVKLDGDDEATSIRGKDLKRRGAPVPAPAPAPAAAAPPPPPPPCPLPPPAAAAAATASAAAAPPPAARR